MHMAAKLVTLLVVAFLLELACTHDDKNTSRRSPIIDSGRRQTTANSSAILEGRVVDTKSAPLAGVEVSVSSKVHTWVPEILPPVPGQPAPQSKNPWKLQTTEDGNFRWLNMEPGHHKVLFHRSGFRNVSETLSSGTKNADIVMCEVPKIVGTVTDAITGEPIREYNLRYTEGLSPYFKSNQTRKEVEAHPEGKYELTFDLQRESYRVLVRSPTHYPAISDPIPDPHGKVVQDFALRPGDPVVGFVTDSKSAPLPGVQIGLSSDHELSEFNNGSLGSPDSTTDTEGRFELWPSEPPFTIVAVDESGYAFVDDRTLTDGEPIQLKPWVKLTGTAIIGTTPAVGASLSASLLSSSTTQTRYRSLWAHTDSGASGEFAFDKLVPGDYLLTRWVQAGTSLRRPGYSRIITLGDAIAPDILLGGDGRSIQGKVAVPAHLDGLSSDTWSYCIVFPAKAESLEVIDPATERWKSLHSFAAFVDQTGRFCIDDVRPGRYSIEVVIMHSITSRGFHGDEKILGRAHAKFDIPEFEPGADLPPMDLGELPFVEAN